ncbi:hypothetical protein ACO0R3_001941 [Hanseniaspora guilliermondii]
MTNKKKTNESNDSKQITPKSNKIIHAEDNNEFDDLSYNGNISTLDNLSKNIYKSNLAFDSPYSNLLKSASKNYHSLYNNTSPGNVLENLMFYNQHTDTNQRSSALVFESNIRSNKMHDEENKNSHNVIGDFLLSSPFNRTNNSPESINQNNIFSHNLELFKTPLKTPVLNLQSLNKSVSQSNLKLLSNQQSSINNLFNNDMTHFNQMIQELQSPSVMINNAKEMKKEKKRTLKNELNNDICKTDDENSEETIELSYTESVHKDQLVSSPLISKLKKSGNKLPKIPRKLNNTSRLPRMGSFTTNSQSRLTSLNNTTLNSSGTQNEETDQVLNKPIVLPKTKKVKKKTNQKQKKYQIVLKFPETF